MESTNIQGCRRAVSKMLFYYVSALLEAGCADPNQIIATELGEMINLSHEQVNFAVAHVNSGFHLMDDLKSVRELVALKDSDSSDIALKLLDNMIDIVSDTISEIGEIESNDNVDTNSTVDVDTDIDS